MRGKEEPMNEQEVAERIFGIKDGEGTARWWGGGLATIKATGKDTGDLYSIMKIPRTRGSPSAAPPAPQRGRGLLRTRRRDDLPYRRADDKGATPALSSSGPRTFPTPTPSTLVRQSYCFFSRRQASRVFIEAISKPAKALTLPPSESESPSDEVDTTDEAESESFAVLEARYGCEIVGTQPGHQTQ